MFNNYNASLQRAVEEEIRLHLTEVRKANPDDYLVPTLTMYTKVSEVWRPGGGFVTSGFFNKIISSMKRAGIIGTTKGGESLFLSNTAWGLYKEKQNVIAEKPRQIAALIDELSSSGPFPSREKLLEVLKEDGLIYKTASGFQYDNIDDLLVALKKFVGGAL